jgi:hypothetical protein
MMRGNPRFGTRQRDQRRDAGLVEGAPSDGAFTLTNRPFTSRVSSASWNVGSDPPRAGLSTEALGQHRYTVAVPLGQALDDGARQGLASAF